ANRERHFSTSLFGFSPSVLNRGKETSEGGSGYFRSVLGSAMSIAPRISAARQVYSAASGRISAGIQLKQLLERGVPGIDGGYGAQILRHAAAVGGEIEPVAAADDQKPRRSLEVKRITHVNRDDFSAEAREDRRAHRMSDDHVLRLLSLENLVDMGGQTRLVLRRGHQIPVPKRPLIRRDHPIGALRGVVQLLANPAVDLVPCAVGVFRGNAGVHEDRVVDLDDGVLLPEP